MGHARLALIVLLISGLAADWMRLVSTLEIARSSNSLHHLGIIG